MLSRNLTLRAHRTMLSHQRPDDGRGARYVDGPSEAIENVARSILVAFEAGAGWIPYFTGLQSASRWRRDRSRTRYDCERAGSRTRRPRRRRPKRRRMIAIPRPGAGWTAS
jgi:hypothetical protein